MSYSHKALAFWNVKNYSSAYVTIHIRYTSLYCAYTRQTTSQITFGTRRCIVNTHFKPHTVRVTDSVCRFKTT